MASTRVYKLAKELGVKSSAIVEKCQAEGLDVKNHMSTISAGLAATIKEWFSEGENVTTVETSSKVDLKSVRRKKRKKKKAKKKEEAEEKQETEVKEEKSKEEKEEEEKKPHHEAEPEKQAEPQVKKEEMEAEKEKAEKEKEKKKEEIKPVGPKLDKPQPAQLSGPKVVRVEKPEPPRRKKRKPKSRKPSKKKREEPLTQPLMPGTDKPPKKSKRKRKDRTHGRRHDDEWGGKKAKFDSKRRQRDFEERKARLDAAGGKGQRLRPKRTIESVKEKTEKKSAQRPSKATISEPIHVKDLSAALAVKTSEIIVKLMQQGVMANANQTISNDVAELVAMEFGTELTVEKQHSTQEIIEKEFKEREHNNTERRTVVCTMLGHVDHGKTSLLDKIRESHVQETEAGGITQHISAYQIEKDSHKITFLDTPGHAAFTAMRARGANMTDVVVLVVAADDGVMPQTVEVINHAKAADVEVIVALNKCDLPGCDYNRIYAQLAEHELTPVEWGGDTEVVKTSAITGEGIEDLLEHIDFVSELLELKTDNSIPATGWVVEAELSSTEGVVATLLPKEGQIKSGDIVLSGPAYGRIKAMRDCFGKPAKKAISSMPVEITGLDEVPDAGEKFFILDDINRAKEAAEEYRQMKRENTLAKKTQVTLDNLFSQIEKGKVKELNVILRADVQGSLDVLKEYLVDLSTDEVKVKIIHSATGGITEGDVVLAEASNAIVIGFNVVPEDMVEKIAESKGVDIRTYTVIYRITEDLEKSMVGLLEPEKKEQSLGRAVVRQTFKVSRLGTIAGCYVNDGLIKKNAKARLIRDNVVVRDNLEIESLKRFKDDVKEVKAGLECGIKLEKYDDIKVDDVLDFFEIVEVARSLR